MIFDFFSVFESGIANGKLYWKNPPKNHAEKMGREAGFICIGKRKNKSYWYVRCFGLTFKRARVIFCMAHGRWPEPFVDHINGNSLDDRPNNLRECTASQNAANSKDKKRIHNLPRGVYLTKQQRFMARITKGGVSKSLGTFDTREEARVRYLQAKRALFHEFA